MGARGGHVAEVPLIGRKLAVGVQVAVFQKKHKLLLGKILIRLAGCNPSSVESALTSSEPRASRSRRIAGTPSFPTWR